MKRLTEVLGSTFWRIVIGYVLVAAVLAGAWLYSLSGPLTTAVIAQQQRNMTAVAQSAALLVEESDRSPQQIAEQLVARTDLRLTIVDATGEVVADSHSVPSQMENHADRPEVREALAGDVGVARRTSATEGREQIYVAVPGSLNGEKAAIRVAQSLEDVRLIATRLRRFGLTLLAAALMLSLFIAWRATRSATQPVQDLAGASRRMAQGDLSVAIPAVPADLSALADSLTSLKYQMKSRIDALETERRTLRAALNGLTDAVLVVEAGTVVLANTAAVSLFAPTGSSAEGAGLDALSLPASLRAAIRRQLEHSESSVAELDPDPTGQAWRVAVAPLRRTDSPSRTIVVITDVTERVRLDRVRREFVANASHELKTPVAGIKLLAESAAMASADGDRESAAIFTSEIAGQVERLQRLVTDLLDLSRLETLPAPDSITDVRVVVENAVLVHRLEAERKGIDLSVDLSTIVEHDMYVAADPTDVTVALDNLLANAIHYTDAGSVRVTVTPAGDDVIIDVTDTGSGIAEEHLARIFERFYRVDEGRGREAGGTGLGLALVKHVAERNRGTVSVASSAGRGSTFTLRLPRHR